MVGLAAGSAALVLLNLVLKSVADPRAEPSAWLWLFDVNREANVPTMWNALLLLSVAAGCFVVALLASRRLAWVVPGMVATVMAFDEVLRLHERLRGVGSWASAALPFDLPTYAWVLPGAVIALAAAVSAAMWAHRLPADVRGGVLLGVAIYFLGAVVVEAFTGWVDRTHGVGAAYAVLSGLEEVLEMLGCVVVAAAVLRMLRLERRGDGWVLRLRGSYSW